MRRFAKVAALVLAALVLGGCAGRGPMTDSEFLGFCHSADKRRAGCDSVAMCDTYLQAVGRPQAGLKPCIEACAEVRDRLREAHTLGGCANMASAGNDWCQRYCRTLYPE
jgi:hypothetical protein